MAKKFTVSAELRADDKASRVIGAAESRFRRFAGFMTSGLAIGAGIAATAFFGFQRALRASVQEAEEGDATMRRLEASLERFGPAAEVVQRALLAQASALAAVTNASQDQILASQRLLAEMGATPAQIEKSVQAALDLSAALGIDLNQAARLVGATLSGSASKLARIVPELRGLSEEALRAGEGIDVLAEKFSGRAGIEADTLSGALSQLSEEMVELGGKTIKGSGLLDTMKASVQGLTEAFRFLKEEQGAAFVNDLGGDPFAAEAAFESQMIAALESAKATEQHTAAVQRNAELLAFWKHGLSAATVGLDALTAAEARALRIAGEQEKAQKALAESLTQAGVTLRDFDAELAANEESMLRLQEAYRATGQNALGTALALSQLQAKQVLIRQEMEAAAAGTGAFTEQVVQASEAGRVLATTYETVNQVLTRTAAQAESARLALFKLAREAAESGDIQGAIAAGARLSQGGTRLRLPGGGSRLVR